MGVSTEEKLRREGLAKQGLKICSKCKRELPYESFSKNSSSKDGYNSYCKECYKEYRTEHKDELSRKEKEWRENNKEHKSEVGKKYYQKNKEKISARQKEYNAAHQEEISLNKKIYRENNKEQILLKEKEYRDSHKEEIKEKQKMYYLLNRLNRLEYSMKYYNEHIEEIRKYRSSESGKAIDKRNKNKRRALINGNGGTFSIQDVRDLLDFFDNKCAYTGEPLVPSYHLDHVVALSKGGTNYIWNLVPSNPFPNLSKNANDMESWYRQQPYFSEERLLKIYEWIGLQKVIKGENNYDAKNIEQVAV